MSDTDALLPVPPAGIALNSPDMAGYFVCSGLSRPEQHGRWTDGEHVRIAFRLPDSPPGGVVLTLELLGYVARGRVAEQRVMVRVNGHRLPSWIVMDSALRPRNVEIPPAALGPTGRVELDLHIPTCVQPARLGLGGDMRYLGLLLRRLAWQPLAARRPPDLSGERDRKVGRESLKSFAAKIDSGFWTRFITGPDVLDIGFQGYGEPGSVVPIMPGAIGIDIDYPGYDGHTLPFANASQDAVYSSHCLEHIADHLRAIQEWHRVLRVGGHIITVVPSAHLYERRWRVPSRWNSDHRRTYTPTTLLAEFEAALRPNTYRVRHLAENDAGYRYDLPPDIHPEGCHEIELVVEKIAPPGWRMGE